VLLLAAVHMAGAGVAAVVVAREFVVEHFAHGFLLDVLHRDAVQFGGGIGAREQRDQFGVSQVMRLFS